MNKSQIESGVRSLLKVIGAILIARGMTQSANIVNGEDVLGLCLVVAGLVWSWKTHKPEPTEPPASGPALLKLLIGCIVPLALLTGCSTPGKVIATSSSTVEHALKMFAVYSVDGHATEAQREQVKRLQADYYAAEDVALAAYAEFSKSGEKLTWEKARDFMWAQENALIALIEGFTGKKVTP
jgi:hypothetical protein